MEETPANMTGESNVVLTNAASEAMGFLGRICNPAADQLGLWFADKVFLARVKNISENVQDWQDNIEKRGIKNPKPISPKILFPYLEAVQFEDEPELRKLWANLMTNYVDPEKNLLLTVYPSILKQLSSNEILVLIHIANTGQFNLKENASLLKSSGEISNLERLGLVKNKLELRTLTTNPAQFGYVDRGQKVEEVGSDEFYLTGFGWDFLLACGVH